MHVLKGSHMTWLQVAKEKLASFASLPPNWNGSGDNTALPNDVALGAANLVLESLYEHNIEPATVLPSSDEGVTIAFVKNLQYAEIVCLNDGEIVTLTTNRKGGPDVVGHGPSEPVDVTSVVAPIVKFFESL